MLPSDKCTRVVQKCAEATTGYVHAGLFAGFWMTGQALEAWARCCHDMAPASPDHHRPKSWFRHPDLASSHVPTPAMASAAPWMTAFSAPSLSPADVWQQAFSSAMWPSPSSFLAMWSSPMCAPATNNAWVTQAPIAAPVSVWMMTWSLMMFGLPHGVAKPAAEANQAALEAWDSAHDAANESLSGYYAAFGRDDPEPKRPSLTTSRQAMLTPFLVFWPWLTPALTVA